MNLGIKSRVFVLLVQACGLGFVWLLPTLSLGQVVGDDRPKSEAEQITESQQRLGERYQLLEDKLFKLFEYERDQNPIRSKVLKRAYLQSQEKMTRVQFNTILQFLNEVCIEYSG